MTSWIAPGGPGIRVESHLYAGYSVPHHYDSMVAKIIAWGKTRSEAIARMRVALLECEISGIETTIPLQLDLLEQPAVLDGGYTIQYLEKLLNERVNVGGSAHGS